MNTGRRNFVKCLPAAALLPQQALSQLTSESLSPFVNSFSTDKIDALYNSAIVIDGIIITRNWNEVADEALAKSGYTGFNASLDSGSLKKALDSLSDWHMRIKNNPSLSPQPALMIS